MSARALPAGLPSVFCDNRSCRRFKIPCDLKVIDVKTSCARRPFEKYLMVQSARFNDLPGMYPRQNSVRLGRDTAICLRPVMIYNKKYFDDVY